jgi:hypothetical protein
LPAKLGALTGRSYAFCSLYKGGNRPRSARSVTIL